MAFQLLLAAAPPLAGGTVKRAWHPACNRDATHDSGHCSMQAVGAVMAPAAAVATPVATALLRLADSLMQDALTTQLDIELKSGAHPEPPRRCNALARPHQVLVSMPHAVGLQYNIHACRKRRGGYRRLPAHCP